MSVPKTFINGSLTSDGLEPEARFAASLIEGKQTTSYRPSSRELRSEYDLVILGGGPAGLTAAIYAQRSGLESIVLEKATMGGQIAITPFVENYPGFPQIAGRTLVELMAKQAMQYVPVEEGVEIKEIRKLKAAGFYLITSAGEFKARAILIATGASHRRLGVRGEKRLAGRGVSYCSTCDGYLFKDGGRVVVVGGGNSALTDAIYLDGIGADVTLVHRSDTFKAEKRLQDTLRERGIKTMLKSRVTEIRGDDVVREVDVEHMDTAAKETIKADGIFIAVGYAPSNEIASKLGLKIDAGGYIMTDSKQRTSEPYVFAAGDVTGGIKQITVAVAQGSIAAITAFEELNKRPLRRPLPT